MSQPVFFYWFNYASFKYLNIQCASRTTFVCYFHVVTSGFQPSLVSCTILSKFRHPKENCCKNRQQLTAQSPTVIVFCMTKQLVYFLFQCCFVNTFCKSRADEIIMSIQLKIIFFVINFLIIYPGRKLIYLLRKFCFDCK